MGHGQWEGGSNKGLEGPLQEFLGSLARSKHNIPEGNVLGVPLHPHCLRFRDQYMRLEGPLWTAAAPSLLVISEIQGSWPECRGIAFGIYQLEGVDQCSRGCPGDARFWGGLSCSERPLMASGTPWAPLRMRQSPALLTCQSLWPGTGQPGLTLVALPLLSRNLTWLSVANGHIPYASSQRPHQLALTYLLGLCVQSLLCQTPCHAHALPLTEKVFSFFHHPIRTEERSPVPRGHFSLKAKDL